VQRVAQLLGLVGAQRREQRTLAFVARSNTS
jgi:hypothetical protein